MRRSDIDAQLEILYAQIPQPGCKGLCQDSCGPLGMHPRERQRLREHGFKVPHAEEGLAQLAESDYTCPALKDGQCGAYEVRPMLCRLWGATESLPCPYGCVPENGLLPDQVGHRLLAESINIGDPNALTPEQLDGLERRLDDPTFRRTVQQYVQHNRPRRASKKRKK